jgi:hypothetical protein
VSELVSSAQMLQGKRYLRVRGDMWVEIEKECRWCNMFDEGRSLCAACGAAAEEWRKGLVDLEKGGVA